MFLKYITCDQIRQVVLTKARRNCYSTSNYFSSCKSNVINSRIQQISHSNLTTKCILNNNYRNFTGFSNHDRHKFVSTCINKQRDAGFSTNQRLLFISQHILSNKAVNTPRQPLRARNVSQLDNIVAKEQNNNTETEAKPVKAPRQPVRARKNVAQEVKSVPKEQNNNTETESKIPAKDLEILSLKFPQPKNILHSFFDIVSMELQSATYKVAPQYKLNPAKKKEIHPTHWTCTYSIKWPEELKFQNVGLTKREASSKAAYKVLHYLQKSGKMLENGLPKFYDKQDFKKVINESQFSLILDKNLEEKLKSVNQFYETKLKPYIKLDETETNSLDEISTVITEDNVLQQWSSSAPNISQRQLDLYRAKETVDLPIQKHRQEFEKLLDNNRVVIIRGEPGCGKSTRIPQYVLEYWVNNMGVEPARIVVTQPRRIAAISLAERVAQERNEMVGNIVGYQVRLKSAFNPRTGRILYCTTGILLRQIQADPSLSRCTHIILDEAHERDVNTDLLMNLIRHAISTNPNLKLIIMSATIDVGMFQNYFENAPVMNVPGFTYPVKVHFLEDVPITLARTKETWNQGETSINFEEVARVIQWIDKTKPEGAILCFLPGWEDILKTKQLLLRYLSSSRSLIVAIHSKLSYDDQRKIFSRPPPGVRKVILATNIAETSVTVDDVVYVVDTGIHKESRFDTDKGIMCIDNHHISQSSMNQRKGRAGRVQPGESFHLYPKSKFESMLKFSIPEILRVSLTKIVLDAKVYSQNMSAIDFFTHLPCPPKDVAIVKAVEELQDLEMLDSNENLTPLGRVVSDFQLPPKLSKAMIHSVIYKCVVPIVDITTLFSADSDMFATTLTDKDGIKRTKSNLCKDSDHISLMILFEQWANMMNNNELHEAAIYCTKHNLVPQKLNTLKKLKDIHYEYLEKYLKDTFELSNDFSANKEFIKGVLLSGVGTVLLQRKWDVVKGRITKKNVYLTKDKQKATIATESVNHKRGNIESPFLVYINEIRSEMRRTTIIRETSVIQPLTFILFKNSKLCIQEIRGDVADIVDPVLIHLDGTAFKMLCSRENAIMLYKCKSALKEMENYFIYQLTKGGDDYTHVLDNWDIILQMLNDILRPVTTQS